MPGFHPIASKPLASVAASTLPAAAKIDVKFGTFDLNNYVQSWQGGVRRRVVEQVIPRRDGVRIDDARLGGSEVTLMGGWEASDALKLREAVDGLREGLFGQGKAQLRQFDDRHRVVQAVDFITTQVPGGALLSLDFEVRFMGEEPWEKADSLSWRQEVITTDPQTFLVATVGTAGSRPIIKVTASAAALVDALKLTNQTRGGFFSYHGTLAVGKTLVVDVGQQKAEVDGGSVLADFEGDFWPLKTKDNSIKFDGDPCTVRIEWNERWY